MGSLEKHTFEETIFGKRHTFRENHSYKNTDIHTTLSKNNEVIFQQNNVQEYFKERLASVHCMKRADIKTSFEWIITAPEGLSPQEEKAFFQGVTAFLLDRYGKKNALYAVVHKDEGIYRQKTDAWTNKPLLDDSGNTIMERVHGRSHLHFVAMPIVPDIKRGGEKICCKEVINRHELQKFHSDLQQYLDEKGIRGQVVNGVTRERGNRTVSQIKMESLQKENEHLRQEIETLRNQNYTW